mgnify:FL=1
MKALFLAAATLIVTFFAGVIYIAISQSPETVKQKHCRLAIAPDHGHPEVGYTEFSALLRDARKRGAASPHHTMNIEFIACINQSGNGHKAAAPK